MPSNGMQLRPGQTGICWPAEASGQNHQHQAHQHQQGTPWSQDLPPQGERGDRVRRTHSHSPYPAPSATPSPQQHAPPPPNAPQDRKNREGPEETGHGERDEQGKTTGQGRPRLPKTVQSAEGGEGKDKRERLWLLEAPVRKIIHTLASTSQCWGRQTQHGLGVCIWMHLVNGMGNNPSPGQPTLE